MARAACERTARDDGELVNWRRFPFASYVLNGEKRYSVCAGERHTAGDSAVTEFRNGERWKTLHPSPASSTPYATKETPVHTFARGARTTATPLDMPPVVPWWPCRSPHSEFDTYAVHGYPGIYFRDGRRYRDFSRGASRELQGVD